MPIPLRSERQSFRAYYDRHGDVQAVQVEILPKGRRVGIVTIAKRSHRDARPGTKSAGLFAGGVRSGFRVNGMLLDQETAEQLFFALEEALFPPEQ